MKICRKIYPKYFFYYLHAEAILLQTWKQALTVMLKTKGNEMCSLNINFNIILILGDPIGI